VAGRLHHLSARHARKHLIGKRISCAREKVRVFGREAEHSGALTAQTFLPPREISLHVAREGALWTPCNNGAAIDMLSR
jgi:hypothetical protein